MKYLVKWTQTLYGEFEVDAESEEDAKDEVLYGGEYDVNEITDNYLEALKIG